MTKKMIKKLQAEKIRLLGIIEICSKLPSHSKLFKKRLAKVEEILSDPENQLF